MVTVEMNGLGFGDLSGVAVSRFMKLDEVTG